jgi:beta-lactamase class A
MLVLLAGVFFFAEEAGQPAVGILSPLPDADPPPGVWEVSLEDRVREIAERHQGRYGVVVLDPASGQSARVNAEESFTAASIGKLPAMLSLYRAAARGEVDLEAEVSILFSDVQAYGAGVLHEYPVDSTMTLRECAYYLVNESDNTALFMLTRYLGRERIEADLDDIGAVSTRYWVPNSTTPDDVLAMLRAIADPRFTDDSLRGEMLDAMTGTHLEDRIPAGLPDGTRVAHKTGSYEDSYGDAGIVFLGNGEEISYFIVILSDGTDEATARDAMREISRAVHEELSDAGKAR